MLGWSINLFRIFGIQLAVHASFLLLLAYFGFRGWEEAGWLGAGWRVLLIILFFVCVVLHELGHSLTAMRYGVRVPRILLMPIGGMAEFDRLPRQPAAELLITAAGPAVNFVIAALLVPIVWISFWSEQGVAAYSVMDLLINLTLANLVMGIFNLLPVFPMDGGRILRALLAIKLTYLRATYWASLTGKIFSATLAGIAAFYFENYLMAVLFGFIYFAGNAEYRQLVIREQQAAYWAEWMRRSAAAEAKPVTPIDEPPLPPQIYHGRN